MVKFINSLTGCVMWVDGNREDEYLRMGHKIAPSANPESVEDKPKAKPRTRKKKEA